jgi:hypothetical protein
MENNIEQVFDGKFENEVEKVLEDAVSIRENEDVKLALMGDKERVDYLLAQTKELKKLVKELNLKTYDVGDADER